MSIALAPGAHSEASSRTSTSHRARRREGESVRRDDGRTDGRTDARGETSSLGRTRRTRARARRRRGVGVVERAHLRAARERSQQKKEREERGDEDRAPRAAAPGHRARARITNRSRRGAARTRLGSR
eukprot:29192-Pelagococcus_subviridis.AAC.7